MTGRPLVFRSAIHLFRMEIVGMVCLLALYSAISAQKPVLVDYSSREDFQGESLGQWASYPPAQDIGYEPSLTPTRDFDAPGGRSLMRWIQPTRSGELRFGFIKKVSLVANSAGRIDFDSRINAPAETVRIEVGIAGADGHRYTSGVSAGTNRCATSGVSPPNSSSVSSSGRCAAAACTSRQPLKLCP